MRIVLLCLVINAIQTKHLFVLGDYNDGDLLNKGTVKLFRELFTKAYKIFRKHVDMSTFSSIQNETLHIIYKHYADDINTDDTNNSIQKLILGSSKLRNDVSTYSKCASRESFESSDINDISNYTFFIVASNVTIIDLSSKKELFYIDDYGEYGNNFLFGLCLRKDITDLHILSKFIYHVNIQLGFFFNITSDNEVIITNMKEVNNMSLYNLNYYSMIPGIGFIILLIFVIIPKIPTYLFTCIIGRNVSKKDTYDFRKCFNVGDNGEVLFNLNQQLNEFNNESGVSYIKGIRGISMILYLLGNVFLVLYKHPTLFVGEIEKIQFIKSNAFAFLIFCIRNTPKILFCCSGFCLAYKYHCYLDDKQNCNSSFLEESIMEFSNLFRFYMYQFHKYIIAILCIFIFKYTLKELFHYVYNFSPSIEIFIQSVINKIKLSDIIGHFLLYKDFTEISFYKSTKHHFLYRNCIMTIFDLLLSEIFFFIISSFLLYFWHKKQIHYDNIIIVVTFLIIIIKCFIMLINPNLNSLRFYFDTYVNRFFTNTIMNYHYYLIGMFFGLVNYSIQKGITINDVLKKDFYYLTKPLQIEMFLKYISNNNKIYTCIWILMIFSGLLFAMCFGYIIDTEKTILYYLLRIVSGVDIEIFILLLFICVGVSYLKGGELCYRFISNKNWMIVNKLYFSFIICCKPCVYFILYQSETRIRLRMFSVVFYGLICGILCFVGCAFLYIVCEMPMKRGIKVGMRIFDKKKKKKRELPKNLMKENLIMNDNEEDDDGEGEMIDLDKLEDKIS